MYLLGGGVSVCVCVCIFKFAKFPKESKKNGPFDPPS